MENLNEIISKTIKEEIQTILEYSFQRKDFINRVESIFTPILSHWVLIRYYRIIDVDNINMTHWKQEIQSWIMQLMRMRLKNNNEKNRDSAIQNVYDNFEFQTNYNSVYLTIYTKCEKEGIDMDDNEVLTQAIKDCQQELNTIKHIIVQQDVKFLKDYLKKL